MTGLLTASDGEPVAVENAAAKGPFVFVCEHASKRLPERLGTLGLPDEALGAHIAWDPGALAVAQRLSRALDGVLIHQRFSRLAYDCNRPPTAEGAMPAKSEVYDIPGNRDLTPKDRAERVAEIYEPFRHALSALIRARLDAGRPTILVTMHSFTPVYFGRPRAVELGILHDADSRLADAMLLAAERSATALAVRRNEPYGPEDGVTHTLIEHGLANGIANVMLEVRNDLLETEDGQDAIADVLRGLLDESLASL
ncbi:N-formylglutamate amidohydrolase [Ensifer soli]|uniref:N-formylglutamate amidohydrolase n=1 Tax=Ciceribacter sp. sgz301302 TaxID=3342379 RepID=UPI0035B94DF0